MRPTFLLSVLVLAVGVYTATVTSLYCYGGKNCSAPCTETQVESGQCTMQSHEGRISSFRWSCNQTSILYETFEKDGCEDAKRLGLQAFAAGMCYDDATTVGAYLYSCDKSLTKVEQPQTALGGNCSAVAGGCSEGCHKTYTHDAPDCSCDIMQCTDNADVACKNPKCCACCLESCLEGSWKIAGYASEKQCCTDKPSCCPR